MKRVLRRAALGLAALCLTLWLVLGANRGWTKTTVTRWQRDPVTEIDGPVIEKRFVPGVDLLVAGLAGALVLFVVSLFVSIKKSDQTDSRP